MNNAALTLIIKQQALALGFDACGMSKAEKLDGESVILQAWLNQQMHGKMAYMGNHFDKRTDPRQLVEGARTVISLAHNYYTEKKQTDPEAPKLAMYAFGEDYHDVIREKLEHLLAFIRHHAGEVSGRCFVDSAPLLERAWAQRSGIGWVGKNTIILTKRRGSYFFLAEIVIDIELDYDSPVKDYCGTCTRCIEACPTGAIYEPYKLDGSKCISYLTIELKDETLPEEFKGKTDNWMFGCDICQQVCPINSQAEAHNEPRFEPSPGLLGMTKRDWQEMSEETFRHLFKNSPVKRTKFKGLRRNIDFLNG